MHEGLISRGVVPSSLPLRQRIDGHGADLSMGPRQQLVKAGDSRRCIINRSQNASSRTMPSTWEGRWDLGDRLGSPEPLSRAPKVRGQALADNRPRVRPSGPPLGGRPTGTVAPPLFEGAMEWNSCVVGIVVSHERCSRSFRLSFLLMRGRRESWSRRNVTSTPAKKRFIPSRSLYGPVARPSTPPWPSKTSNESETMSMKYTSWSMTKADFSFASMVRRMALAASIRALASR